MMIQYPKIHRLGKDENDGILIGKCFLQEKIDGANTSVWLEEGKIKKASRNHEIESGFNGFVDYIDAHEGIKNLLNDFPAYRLFGEWLVRHTIQYNETAYKKWYMFDVLVGGRYEDGRIVEHRWLTTKEVDGLALKYGIDAPWIIDGLENPSEEYIRSLVGKSQLGEHGEGIVIKNFDYINRFGDCSFAKLVAEKFMEDNAVVFGGNNKHSDAYWEAYVTNKYATLERVRKIMNKIQPTIDEKLDKKHTPRITNTCYHDILTEEIWEIQKKVIKLDFRNLKRIALKKLTNIYHDILDNTLSVAYVAKERLQDVRKTKAKHKSGTKRKAKISRTQKKVKPSKEGKTIAKKRTTGKKVDGGKKTKTRRLS